MSKFLSRKLCNLEAYVPGEQPKDRKYIKLNTNESPYLPAPKVMEVINRNQVEGLNLYSDPDAKILVDELADFYNVGPEQVFVGNGSDEVLGFCFLAFFDEEGKACFPDITYGFYKVYSKSFNIDAIEVPLKEDFTIDVNDYVNCGRNIIIANPNAPTGLTLSHKEIELILKTNEDRVVIIDEAYVDFGSKSCISLLDKYPNLIVVQTFSKSRNLAGARLGFAVASKEIIEDLNKIKFSFSPYNINGLSLVAGVESVKDKAYFEECNNKTIATRERISEEFRKLGFYVIPSKTNFLFVTHNLISGEEYYKALREKGVLTRYYKQPRIDNYVRITIGTDEEMDAVIKITDEILSEILPICVGK
ncbi:MULTISPECIES: histidinol-phosphate transaminase [unclassified Clostridium]|uniref:histidinol-phosphate transaminase n=1 Tax=unclassified Clostridium TaxID=2614128 RepID=UPI0002979820|nr:MULTISPECIES: histidinol-phosphate transaminase [unclassified Clostridium]EKQ58089.1 MAG: histidinol-phosphate aminotransferase [Clostridium sp. Maddingley MBC34-26]